jgi:retron-type reverse transcriptase
MKFFNRNEPTPIQEYNNLTGDKFTGTVDELKQRIDKELDRYKEENIVNLHYILKNKEYKTSVYEKFKLKEYNKVREIYRLPYYPDRIVHHALMNHLETIFVKSFTKDTYSCIKRRGIHKALYNLTKSLRGGVKHRVNIVLN